MAASKKTRHEVEPPSTGHEWDGIREYDNPLPRWWLWTFYACIVWGIGYTVAYPAWPMISGATAGVLGFSTRGEVAADIARVAEQNAGIETKLASVGLDQIAADPELSGFAQNAGASIFRNNCAQCHGSGAAGAKGYPNLLDNDWLWGGSLEDIHTTVTHGIRNTTDADARYSQMPAFGRDGLLEKPQIAAAVAHVRQISGQEFDAALADEGAAVFAENCASCHGDDGTGDRAQGAPNLTDAIWLYGGDVATLTETVSNARFGVMPNWNERLTEAQIRAVASYVHGLGGGE